MSPDYWISRELASRLDPLVVPCLIPESYDTKSFAGFHADDDCFVFDHEYNLNVLRGRGFDLDGSGLQVPFPLFCRNLVVEGAVSGWLDPEQHCYRTTIAMSVRRVDGASGLGAGRALHPCLVHHMPDVPTG